jgi:uncharacterized metal-binding protein YceD (DUF177 family)
VVSAAPKPLEFSRVVSVEALDRAGLELEIEADPQERTALARRFGLEALEKLVVAARLTPRPDREMRLVVTFDADVVQLCVVTLEPVAVRLSERFEVVFAPPVEGVEEDEVVIDVEAEEPPEPLVEGRIDVGEMVAQHLAMAIEPYPRAPGAEMGDLLSEECGSGEAVPSIGPFTGLARLKRGV